ncbi:NADH dehydrogenase [Thermoproteus uzoniensis 768-20]|uniref:NADH dehydrogenase n=1 Tax=Thermoproteus uzoniensis (strain 768-20) TaxID=999630 RepID=F2L094_THEU7|nr:5,6-dimethylbenzimidazole synthase [Thermoproteus uzoniensis]AEA12576.1 NADH dehydrogenase [Thermoproteus uzoniensis 768-20]
MDLYDAIKKRRDVRSYYRSDPIPPRVLAKLLMAAHLAPSVGFSQPWNFILVYDLEKRRMIKELVERERERFRSLLDERRRQIFDNIKVEAILDTPVNLAVTCDPTRFGPHVLGRTTMPELCQYSAVLAVGNLWLAAVAEGIGVGWVSFFHKDDVKRILGIPQHVDLVAYLTLGYVTRFPERPELEEKGWLSRLPLDALVYVDEFGRRPPADLLEELRAVKL